MQLLNIMLHIRLIEQIYRHERRYILNLKKRIVFHKRVYRELSEVNTIIALLVHDIRREFFLVCIKNLLINITEHGRKALSVCTFPVKKIFELMIEPYYSSGLIDKPIWNLKVFKKRFLNLCIICCKLNHRLGKKRLSPEQKNQGKHAIYQREHTAYNSTPDILCKKHNVKKQEKNCRIQRPHNIYLELTFIFHLFFRTDVSSHSRIFVINPRHGTMTLIPS